MGAGKSTLLRSLAKVREYRFYVLDADAAGGFHPSDARGEHLTHDWPIEVQILALHAKIIVRRGFNLLTDPGELLTRHEVDRFLKIVGRSRRDPRVILIRLEVGPDAAVARKTQYSAAYVRASNLGWHPAPVPREVVIMTDHLSAAQVRRAALTAIRDRVGPSYSYRRPRVRPFPKRPERVGFQRA